MMNYRLGGVPRRLLPVVLVVAATAGICHARADSVERLVEISGISAMVATIPAHLQAGLEEGMGRNGEVSGEMRQEILGSVATSVKTDLILEDIIRVIGNSMSGADVASLLTWYESDTGREIAAAEAAASTPEAYEDMLASVESLFADRARLEMAARIDQATNATDLTTELQMSVMEASYAAISSAIQPGEPLELESFRARMAAERPAMRQSVEQLVILSLVYSYQDIPLSRLEDYLAFLQSPEGERFSDVVFRGVSDGLTRAVHRLSSEIGAIFGRSLGTTGAT